MFILYTILASILCAIIDALRIKSSFGQVQNINKVVTFTIGATLFGLCLALIFTNYYDTPSLIQIIVYGLFFASIRGVFYDPILNLLRGKEINYTSTTTNSITDFIERVGLKWDFWTERISYFLMSLTFGLIHYLIS